MGDIQQFLPIILIFAAMYFLMIRPQQNRVKKEKQFESNLKVGDKIVTKAGIHGRISEIADTTIIVRSEEHTSELQSRPHLVCRLLLEKKKKQKIREPHAKLIHYRPKQHYSHLKLFVDLTPRKDRCVLRSLAAHDTPLSGRTAARARLI